jgi:hypothetical protein
MNKVTFKKEKFRIAKPFKWPRPVWYLCIDGHKDNKIFVYEIVINHNLTVYACMYDKIQIPRTGDVNDYFKTVIRAKKFLVAFLNNKTGGDNEDSNVSKREV